MLDIEQQVGQEQAHRIEFPGYIDSLDEALKTLGESGHLSSCNLHSKLACRNQCIDAWRYRHVNLSRIATLFKQAGSHYAEHNMARLPGAFVVFTA